MTEESTRLQALQVQQQLGIQSLSIANQNSQNILALFQELTETWHATKRSRRRLMAAPFFV